jgi:polysaccharide transporter, PST family
VSLRIPLCFASFGRSKENRVLFRNTASLYILQGANYILPLITVPYLVRVLGTESFGLLAFYGSLIAYFQLIVDYGFNLSATREVSLHRRDRQKISNLFFSVLIIKIALALFCAAVLLAFIYAVPRFHTQASLCLWLYCGVAGSILFPTWLYQGMEEMGYIAIFSLLSKVVVAVFYFIVIKRPNDYMWFAYLNSAGAWVIGAVGFLVALRKFTIAPATPSYSSCIACLRGGLQIFLSQLSVSLFTNSNTFILGLFAGNKVVGMYAVAEKIVRALISLTAPVGSAIYPRSGVLFSISRETAVRFLRKVLLMGCGIFGALGVCFFVFADFLVLLVSGTRSIDIALLVRIMSFIPLSVFIDNIYGTQILLNINLQRQFMRIMFTGGAVSVFLLMILVPRIQATGSAISFLTSELTILFLMIYSVRRNGIRLLRKQ